jgi:hypothetical protein
MDMWEWRSGGHWTGVSVDEERALQAAEDHLAIGETAYVERVHAFLSFRTMSSFYVPTGQAWTATRESVDAVIWHPATRTSRDPPAAASGVAPQAKGNGRDGTGEECTMDVVVRPCGVNRSRIGSSSSIDRR